jgi:hypothetical protein
LRSARAERWLLAGLVAALGAWFLWPFLAHHHRFPLGPDGPVYLWWTRLAGADGLSAVADRPGVPALALLLDGALGRSVVEAVAALEVALGIAVGLACAALLRGRASAVGWALGGLLGGTFAVHLAAGYVANLLHVTTFLGAAAVLSAATGPGASVAAGALAAGALAHPSFALVAGAILLLASALGWRRDRAGSRRIGAAVLRGGVIAAGGFLALLSGPPPPDVATSRDGYLRAAGLAGDLRGVFLDRLADRWARYVQWASVPLAILGWRGPRDGVRRFLGAWAVATAAGVALGAATGWFPADRLVTFGFAIPILAALGLERVLSWRRRRAVAIAASGALTLAMLAGAMIAWNRQEPFIEEEEVRTATLASALVAARADADAPLAFLVNERDATVSFLAARAGNVIRASVPASWIRDVVVVVPPASGVAESPERRALERVTARDLADAERAAGRRAVTVVLRPFDDVDDPSGAIVVAADRAPLVSGSPSDPLEPATAAGIALSSALVLALAWAAGFGWARCAIRDRLAALAAAPALGAAALVLGAIALERAGLPIDGPAGAWAASALGGGGGYVVWRVLERRPAPGPTPQVEQ